MDSPVGKIVSISNDSATVEVERIAACARCAAGKGCGAGLLSGSTKAAILEVSLSPHSQFSAGDEVRLKLEPAHLLRATILVYGLPLAGMVLGPSAGWLISRPLTDGVAVAYAAAGLAAGFIASRWLLNRNHCLKQFIPKIEGPAGVAS
jgi:sigma-E factor negative regulatory protein RseC